MNQFLFTSLLSNPAETMQYYTSLIRMLTTFSHVIVFGDRVSTGVIVFVIVNAGELCS